MSKRWPAWLTALGLLSGTAAAQEPPPEGVWTRELSLLLKWLDAQRSDDGCEERCYALSSLTLFGPADRVRIDGVTLDGAPASVSFEENRYFLLTGQRSFTLRGTLAFSSDRVLEIPGPLNRLSARLDDAGVAEGDDLSGLSAAALHLSPRGEEARLPPVFQLARAFRVEKDISFEYRLVLQSGSEIGTVELPLTLGERVLDVPGVSGWKVEADKLFVPTAGRAATLTIEGTLPSLTKLSPDARSAYE